MAQEFSFDIVSKTDMQEVTNAVQQARRELGTRFDFRGSKSDVELGEEEIILTSDDPQKLKSVRDVLEDKLVKRKVSLKAIDYQKIEDAALGTVRQRARIVQGIETDKAKEIVRMIKDAKIRVQASIQGDQVRVAGKNKDDLQRVMVMARERDFGIPLQFVNYRG